MLHALLRLVYVSALVHLNLVVPVCCVGECAYVFFHASGVFLFDISAAEKSENSEFETQHTLINGDWFNKLAVKLVGILNF